MSTAKEQLLHEAEGPIEGIVFGAWGWGNLPVLVDEEGIPEREFGEPNPPIPPHLRGVLLKWEDAEPWLEIFSCYTGYGAPDCYAITAWTPSQVLFIVQYDGSTSLQSVPRNPVSHNPRMPGG
jgi:hypothetical protein